MTPADPASASAGISAGRRALLPAPTLPLVHLAGAHLALAIAFALFVADPGLAGPYHYHPRLIAVLHLVTLGWITGSILGALYIVAPLAFGLPFRAGRGDVAAALGFWLGTAGVVSGFWLGRFAIVAYASVPVLGALAFVGARWLWRLPMARAPWGVSLHLELAFLNVFVAGAAGGLMAVNRLTGGFPWAPPALAAAHGHLAALGWATMMIFGVGYRLIPMFLPAAMPAGRGLGVSAILLETGTLWLAMSLAAGWSPGPPVLPILGGCAAFFWWVRRTLRDRRPPPIELPRHDWSMWHARLALSYLAVAIALGCWLAFGNPPAAATWAYGCAGILGFLAQMVSGIQGRLLPLFAWYRALERRNGDLPRHSVHRLIAPALACAIFCAWLAGLPVFTAGLMTAHHGAIAAGAATLLGATVVSAVHGVVIVRRAES